MLPGMSTEAGQVLFENTNKTKMALALFASLTSIILLAYYFPLIAQGMTFYASDHNFYFEPFARFIGESYRNFHVPLWNPYIYAGMPQIAVPSPGIFYPPNLIWSVSSYAQGLGLILALHQLLAGLGAFLLIEGFGWGLEAAFVAGSICAFCGYMFSLNSNHTLVTTASWIPINLWLMTQIKLAPRGHGSAMPLRVLLSSLAILMLIAAGRPEISVIGLLIIALFALFQSDIWKREVDLRTEAIKKLSWQAFAFLIASLLAMPLVLPVVEWLLSSPRAQGMDVKWVFTWSANWYDLLCFIFAQPFGDLQTLGSPFFDLAASRPHHLPFLPSPLIGPVAATLGVWALTDKQWAGRAWLAALAFGTFLIMIGSHTVFIPKLFALIPAVTLFRYPIKLAVVIAFCFAVLAARGTSLVCRGQLERRAWIFTLALWIVSFDLGALIYLMALFNHPIPFPNLANNSQAQILIGLALLTGSLLGLVVVAIAWLINHKIIASGTAALVLNILLILSLTLPAFYYRPRTTVQEFFTSPSWLLAQLKHNGWKNSSDTSLRLLPLYSEPVQLPDHYCWRPNSSYNQNYYHYARQLLVPQTNMDYQVSETFGYEAALTLDYEQHVSSIIRGAIENNRALNTNTTAGSATANLPDGQLPKYLALAEFCRSSATGFVASQVTNGARLTSQLDPSLFDLVVDSEAMNLRIYRVKHALPRAFMSYTWHWMKDHNDALRTTLTPRFTHFDPSQPVIERLPKDSPAYTVEMPQNYSTGSEENTPRNADLRADLNINKNDAILTQSGYLEPTKHVSIQPVKEQAPVFLTDTQEHISISVNLAKPGFLVLSDRYYPGWKSQIDGIPAPIFRANGLFRAVYLAKGGHLVQFTYEPDSLMVGLYIAGAGLTLDMVLLFFILGPKVGRAFKRMAGQPV